jgi:hypothetical protein
MKSLSYFILFILSCNYLHASNICEIATGMFHIDSHNKLILINQDIGTLSKSVETVKLGTENYVFNEVVDAFEIGKKYEVNKGADVYILYFTELPVVRITTNVQIEKADPNEMSFNDPENSGSINGYSPSTFVLTESSGETIHSDFGIRIRGALSRYFIKKSFRIEFWEDPAGTEKDVSLLGIARSDGDWNLQAMWHESLKLRSKVSADIWRQIHTLYYSAEEPEARGGFEMKYVEVFINNNYRGVYLISERYDRKQLKLKKLKEEKGNITIRGELIKTATDPSENGAMRFFTVFANTNSKETTEIDKFEYEYPDMDDESIPNEYKGKYDWTNFRNLAGFIVNSTDDEFNANYKSRLDMTSFVDNFIFLNLMKGQDNSVKNVYYGRYKEDEPYFILPWDLDATWGAGPFGNTGDRANAEIVSIDKDKNNIYVRMWKDNSNTGFPKLVRQRWNLLRKSVISYEKIKKMFKDQYDYLIKNSIYDREELRWADFEKRKTTDWGSYQNRFDYLDQWIKDRIEYLDEVFNYDPVATGTTTDELEASNLIRIYPNPAFDYIYISGNMKGNSTIKIFDMNGRLVKSENITKNDTKIYLSELHTGIYFIRISGNNCNVVNKLVIL